MPTVCVVEGWIPTTVWAALQRTLRYRDPKAHFSWRGLPILSLLVGEPGGDQSNSARPWRSRLSDSHRGVHQLLGLRFCGRTEQVILSLRETCATRHPIVSKRPLNFQSPVLRADRSE